MYIYMLYIYRERERQKSSLILHIQLRFCPLQPPILRFCFAFTTSTTFGYSTLRIGMCLRFWCWEVAWQPGGAARGGRPANGARIQPERPLGMKKNVFPIFFLNDKLPVNLSLILRLVVTAMKRNTRSKFDRPSFSFFGPIIEKRSMWEQSVYILPSQIYYKISLQSIL